MKYWRVTVQKGVETMFESRVPVNIMTDAQIRGFLEFLIRKHALTDEEVLQTYC